MATVKGYISSKVNKLYLKISDDELDAALAESEVDGDATYDNTTARGANIVLLGIMPELLAMPDIAEDSLSVKFDRDAILKFCSLIAAKYSLNDPFEVDQQNSIVNISDIW